MRTLAIDTATPVCSVALFEGGQLLGADHAEIGRGHAERLIPAIAALPQRGRADRILVDVGPGSFTGIRVGLSAAKALALAWGAQCEGYRSLQLLAAMAGRGVPVDVAMLGGHGEYFFQPFDADCRPLAGVASLKPQEAASRSSAAIVAGSAAEALIALRGHGEAGPKLPDNRNYHALMRCDTFPASAQYGRGADAKPAVVQHG